MTSSKVMRSFVAYLVSALLVALISSNLVQAEVSNSFTNGSISVPALNRQVSPGVFDCKSSNELIQAVCKVVLALVNRELSAAGISINKEEVLFSYNDGKDIVLQDGCSSKTEINNIHIQAKFRTSQSLNIMGNLIFEPLVVPYRLPITVRARVDAKQRFGKRVFGACIRFPSDRFHANGHLDTNADVVVGLSLKPSFRQIPDGNYELKIKPDVALMFNLENTDLKFHISGVSFLSKIVGTITGFLNTPSKLFKAIISVFQGDKLKEIWRELVTDIAVLYGTPLVLGVGLLPRNIEQAFYDLFDNPIERAIEKKAKGFGEDIEDKLTRELRKILKVGADGYRRIIIKKNVVDLLKHFGVDSDEFFATKVASGGSTSSPPTRPVLIRRTSRCRRGHCQEP